MRVIGKSIISKTTPCPWPWNWNAALDCLSFVSSFALQDIVGQLLYRFCGPSFFSLFTEDIYVPSIFMTVTLELRHWWNHFKPMVLVHLKYCLPNSLSLLFSNYNFFYEQDQSLPLLMCCHICVTRRNMIHRVIYCFVQIQILWYTLTCTSNGKIFRFTAKLNCDVYRKLYMCVI